MFHASILQIQEELHYHQQQQEKLEQELYTLKSYEEFASQAFDNVRDTIEQIEDPKCLELFKESLLSLFPTEAPLYLEKKLEEGDIEYLEEGDPDYKSIKQLQQEEPDTVVAVFHSEQHLKEQNIKSEKTYYELTGKPDLRPDTYEDLTPNITYSSDGTAYIGFDSPQEAESFRENITVPSMVDKAVIMNKHSWELKFYCDREYLEGLIKDVKKPSKFEKIGADIIFNHNDSSAYVAFSAKGRADTYGSYLTRILDIASEYTVSNKPSFVKDSKYELRLEEISLEDATHLTKFNLKRDYDHPDHREVREVWRTTRKRKCESACKPLPKAIAIENIKLGDIVSTDATKIKDKQYKVLAHKELEGIPHVEAICIFNREMPALVNKCSWFKEVYPVDLMDVCIAHEFRNQEKEEVLTEDVQVYIPKKKLPTKKSTTSKAKYPTPLIQIGAGDLVHRNGSSIFEVIGMSRLDNKLVAECKLIESQNMKHSIGNTYFLDEVYLCEEEEMVEKLKAAV